jgi:hypothetical protein
MSLFLNDDEELKREAWRIIGNCLPELHAEQIATQVEVNVLLEPPIYRKLAMWFLQRRKAEQTWQFLNTDQLVGIASKLIDSEIDIDSQPGVYLFCSIADDNVLKVGQSNDMRRRIACEHLQWGCMNTNSLLIDHAKRNWSVANDAEWHGSLRDHEVTALIFPMRNGEKWDRLLIEQSLVGTLNPVMT